MQFTQFGVHGRDESDPYAYGMYAAIIYAQPMFIPRIYDICPRTPNVYPRAPTVGADLLCPHIMEHTLWIVHAHQCLFANALYTKVWLSCNLH
ncbi:hypothetical protein [Prevotella pallens]|uniref:hypothetical protein n=1 Tax=Prevotella pallens TaxID=60133 RepID=UPI0028DB5E0A|nr:hypothetical protein [Prevotella pallens]